jgi:hypothetical protein
MSLRRFRFTMMLDERTAKGGQRLPSLCGKGLYGKAFSQFYRIRKRERFAAPKVKARRYDSSEGRPWLP